MATFTVTFFKNGDVVKVIKRARSLNTYYDRVVVSFVKEGYETISLDSVDAIAVLSKTFTNYHVNVNDY